MNRKKTVEDYRDKKRSRIPDLPGIDIQTGLSRVGGNEELLRSLLLQLLQHCEKAPTQIREALNDDNHELAVHHAHTIKGIAANLGARHLATSAGDFEVILRHGKTEKIPQHLKKFEQTIYVLMAGLKKLVAEEPPPPSPTITNGREDITIITALFTDLEQAVHKRLPQQCTEIISQICNLGVTEEYKALIMKLHYYISAYKFEEAISTTTPLLHSITRNTSDPEDLPATASKQGYGK